MDATDTPAARLRARLLAAFAPRAVEHGWTEVAFHGAAADAGLTEGEARIACPRGPHDLFDAFAARADAVMIERLAGLDLAKMRVRERVRAAVQLRLEAQIPHKGAARAMSRALARPDRAPEAGRLLWRTADHIWRALGDPSTDANYYSKRAILAGVLAATYARWFSDDSEDHEPTWAFLAARIDNVMAFEKAKARLAPLAGAAAAAAAAAARLRYGGR